VLSIMPEKESGRTFSDQTGPTKRNGSYYLFFLFRILYISEEKWGNEPVGQNGTANFGRNRNGPFHLTSDRNFRNLWHNGKHPLSVLIFALKLAVVFGSA